ncbi:MAG: protein DpdG [Chloroflexota bacterium]|nr:protein DpdG [Chloroflexota bacterium]
MSVISSLTATPNRLKITIRFVSSCGSSGIKQDLLQQTLLPAELARGQSGDEELQGGSAVGDEVVRELRNLGMLVLSDDDSLKVSPGLIEYGFVDFLQDKMLNPEEAEKHGQGALPKALAWLLSRDPARPLAWEDNYRGLVEQDCGPEGASFELTNRARCNQFVYWARFLGFAWRLQIDRQNVVVPDPTKAIVRNLGQWEAKPGWLPIGEFLSRLAVDLPVLEEGIARKFVESKIAPDGRRPDGHISRSTSYALRRLERSRQLKMQRMADAQAMNLEFGSELRPVSHVNVAGTSGD